VRHHRAADAGARPERVSAPGPERTRDANGRTDRTTSTITTNQTLATEARTRGAHAPADSIERLAYGCISVALSTTGTIASARRVLGLIQPADIQATAHHLLDQLTGSPG